MPRARFGFLVRKIDMVDLLRVGAVLMTMLMVITFFAGCQTRKNDADSNSIIREGPSGREVHGEVGATYGQGTSRR